MVKAKIKYFSLTRPPIKFPPGKLQENLKLLHKKIGERFTLLYRSSKKIHKLPLFLFWDTRDKMYVIKYDGDLYTNRNMFPLSITFQDRDTSVNNNNAFIVNIHKTEKVSGTMMVEMAIRLIWTLGAEKIMIDDGATIDCQGRVIQLSPFKQLEKNRTFYEKFGFRPYDVPGESPRFTTPVKDVTKAKDKAIRAIKAMRIESIRRYLMRLFNIYTTIIRTGDYNSIRFFFPNTIPPKNELRHTRRTIPQTENKEAVHEHIGYIARLFEILPKRGKLWPWLKMAFYKKCDLYQDFMENMIQKSKGIRKPYTGIEWKKRFIWNRYRKPFDVLQTYASLPLKLEK
jgi:hypothetical protein